MFPLYINKAFETLAFYGTDSHSHALHFWDIVHQGSRDAGQEEIEAVKFETGRLEDKDVERWLIKEPRTADQISKRSRLRVLFVNRPENQEGPFDRLTCSKPSFLKIVQAFELPPIFPVTIANKVPHYVWQESRNAAGHRLLSYIARTGNWRQGHAIALTYNVNKRLTSALVQGSEVQGFGGTDFLKEIDSNLRDRSDLANQPAFLPMVAAQMRYQAIDVSHNEYRSDMIQFETVTGHGHMFTKSSQGESRWTDEDLPSMTKSLNNFSSRIIGQAERIRSCLLRHESILQFIDATSSLVPDDDIPGLAETQVREMKQHADFMANGWRCLQHKYDAFEKNMQVLIAVINNISIQRDNKLSREIAHSSAGIAAAARRDSSVMKSISLLTTFFLPATFVSTLFAMPLFNWSASSITAVATPHAWIYVAVALPLTAMTVAIWFAWLWWNGVLRDGQAWETDARKDSLSDEEKVIQRVGS